MNQYVNEHTIKHYSIRFQAVVAEPFIRALKAILYRRTDGYTKINTVISGIIVHI